MFQIGIGQELFFAFIQYEQISRLNIIEIYQHLSQTMNSNQSGINFSSYPQLVSSSIFSDEISIKNGLSTPQIAQEEEALNFALQSFSEINFQDLQTKNKDSRGKHHLQLCRSTSFEQILMENHRTVLIESIRQYFENIKHQIVQKATISKKEFSSSDELTFKEKQHLIQHILLSTGKIDQVSASKIMNRLSDNADQVKIIIDMLSVCPKNIQFQVAYLLTFLLHKCNQLIEHFKPKKLAKELKERSDTYADLLTETQSLKYLFEGQAKSKIQTSFRTLVQKWMITLFLMKVGVFENELKNKSIEDYLKSQVFKNIDLNDLLNQHLIHPFRKMSKKL